MKKKLSEAIIFAVGQPRSSGPTNEYVSSEAITYRDILNIAYMCSIATAN